MPSRLKPKIIDGNSNRHSAKIRLNFDEEVPQPHGLKLKILIKCDLKEVF